MKPGVLDLVIIKGCDFPGKTLRFRDAAGELVDVSEWTFEAQARLAVEKPLAFSLSVVPGTEATQAVIEPMTAEQTMLLTAGSYGWDLVPIQADDTRLPPPLAGVITVKAIFTRPTAP